MFFYRKTSQVADDGQGMFVDGIDVEQVVLHLADDLAEGGNVGGKYTVSVHPA